MKNRKLFGKDFNMLLEQIADSAIKDTLGVNKEEKEKQDRLTVGLKPFKHKKKDKDVDEDDETNTSNKDGLKKKDDKKSYSIYITFQHLG